MQCLFVSVNVVKPLWRLSNNICFAISMGKKKKKQAKNYSDLVREAFKYFFIIFSSQLKYRLKYKM